MAEGARLAHDALMHANTPAHDSEISMRPAILLVSDSGATHPLAGEIFAKAGEKGIERISLADDCFAKVSSLKNTDGLALVISFTRNRPPLAELFARPNAAWLVAAEVQDPGNAGALARTALAAGWSGCIYLEGADPVSPKFLRGGMGAAFRLPCLAMRMEDFLKEWNEWPEAANRSRSRVHCIAASSDPSGKDFRTVDYSPPVALIIGGERGIPPELSSLNATPAHIPLSGNVESLNLAVAAGVLLFSRR